MTCKSSSGDGISRLIFEDLEARVEEAVDLSCIHIAHPPMRFSSDAYLRTQGNLAT